jgi:hypothetical protein
MVPHPIAVASDVDEVAVMEDAVDECRGHDFITEYLTPLLE